jgi:hypothetical protein
MAEYKNARRQVGLATKLCAVVPNIVGHQCGIASCHPSDTYSVDAAPRCSQHRYFGPYFEPVESSSYHHTSRCISGRYDLMLPFHF